MPKNIRQIRIEGNIAYVPLTQGYEAIIDASNIELVRGSNWSALVQKNNVYAIRSEYVPKRRTIYMHRVIIALDDGLLVDHVNGNGLDNRMANLRAATHAQNCQNAKKKRINTSGYKGVSPFRGKWRAQLNCNGIRVESGTYETKELAHEAYKRASAAFHRDFGRLK